MHDINKGNQQRDYIRWYNGLSARQQAFVRIYTILKNDLRKVVDNIGEWPHPYSADPLIEIDEEIEAAKEKAGNNDRL